MIKETNLTQPTNPNRKSGIYSGNPRKGPLPLSPQPSLAFAYYPLESCWSPGWNWVSTFRHSPSHWQPWDSTLALEPFLAFITSSGYNWTCSLLSSTSSWSALWLSCVATRCWSKSRKNAKMHKDHLAHFFMFDLSDSFNCCINYCVDECADM